MNFKYLANKQEFEQFIKFGNELYAGNPYYRDSMSDIVKMFLFHQTSYLKHAQIYPFILEQQGQIILRAAFIIDYKQKDLLMIAFFEARENAQDAVNCMLDKARELAGKHGLKRIAIGLDAHLNYGVGFLASHFDRVPCFGFGYSPEYYLTYFKGLQVYHFTSFLIDLAQFNLTGEQKILQKLLKKGFTYRLADFNFINREIEIYTRLNNLCFQRHLWWADRTFEEDRELLYPFRWFIKGENLIIAEKNGEPIAFLLWYPDFNQLIKPGKGIGLSTLLKAKLGIGGPINKFKIAEIGVKPEYQGTGAVLGLFETLFHQVKGKYQYCESGWVEENNMQSKGLGLRWQKFGCQEYKKYQAFEVTL